MCFSSLETENMSFLFSHNLPGWEPKANPTPVKSMGVFSTDQNENCSGPQMLKHICLTPESIPLTQTKLPFNTPFLFCCYENMSCTMSGLMCYQSVVWAESPQAQPWHYYEELICMMLLHLLLILFLNYYDFGFAIESS